METKDTNSVKRQFPAGSALILAVVLTSLLAIVGMMFVMVARVDRISTSAISENRELDSAVEAVVAKISQELVLDVPGMPDQEYYDYPDSKNAWLASLEPHKDGGYKWRQISDVYDRLGPNLELIAEIIPDYQDSSEVDEGEPADADGDGVADSKWIELDGINSNKGRPIYAAIRVIDNGAMLNVNTAYKFDRTNPGTYGEYVDGSDQMQINLFALSKRGTSNPITQLDNARFGSESKNMDNYIRDVVWRYYPPAKGTKYTPFDLSDELELRNRFILELEHIDTRIEREVWTSAFTGIYYLHVPVGQNPKIKLADWFDRAQYDASEPNAYDTYSYRHIGTIYNMDRIIRPNGGKMLNINDANALSVYKAIIGANLNIANADEVAAQVAVNMIDFCDNDSNVATFDPPPAGGTTYYGFERPCIYISELAHKFTKAYTPPGLPYPGTLFNTSYAIELHKPYTEDDYPDANWQLVIEDYNTFPIRWSGSQSFHVMLFENPNAPLEPEVVFDLSDKDPNFPLPPSVEKTKQNLRPGTLVIASGRTISLQRYVGNDWVSVDSVYVPFPELGGTWLKAEDNKVHSYQRDITRHKCIRRLWDDSFIHEYSETLGDRNSYTEATAEPIQAHPEDKPFTNVGEVGMLFRKDVYGRAWSSTDTEADVRLDLADPNYRDLFKYLTVSSFDPSSDNIDNDGDEYTDEWSNPLVAGDEVKVPGRININTAPWYVIAQLPWMEPGIARAIVAYRDKTIVTDQNNVKIIDYSDRDTATGLNGLRKEPGFTSIGELATVINNSGEPNYSMRYYALGAKSGDLLDYPDLSSADGAGDDFEERDVIFSRISNLVTVRSDVFTAYILVRIGTDGPQKRVIAVLDRSNIYPPNGGKVKLVALHPVPDPR